MSASNKTLNYHLKISSFFFTLFIFHYLAWFFGMGNTVGKATAIVCVAMFTVLILFFIIKKPEMRITAFFIMVFTAVSLLTPSSGWDARSIWLFHGKRIFMENNLFAQMDDYLIWSHNDYPVMIPSFSASLANIVGVWNEIFPKSANMVFLFPAMIAVAAITADRLKTALILIFFIYTSNKMIFNGYMDAVFAAYAMVSVITLACSFNTEKSRRIRILLLLCSSLSIAVLVLIKNEGMLVIIGIILSAFIFSIIQKKIRPTAYVIIVSVLPLILLIAWKYICKSNNISNDMLSSDILAALTNRLGNADEMLYIIKKIFLRPWTLFILVTSVILIKLKKNDENLFMVLFCLSYVSFLFVAYLTTPHDVIWHIKSSLNRTMIPVSLISFFTVLNVSGKIHQRSKLTQ